MAWQHKLEIALHCLATDPVSRAECLRASREIHEQALLRDVDDVLAGHTTPHHLRVWRYHRLDDILLIL